MANPAFAVLVSRYHQRHPDVTLELDLSARMVNLVEDGFDLAIRVSSSLEPGLIARKLGEVHFRLVASPAFLERRGRPKDIAGLEGAPFLAYTQVSREGRVPFKTDAGEVEVRFNPVMLSGNESLLMFAAREGMGYAIMPHWLVDDELKAGVLEQVLSGVARPRAPLYASILIAIICRQRCAASWIF